MLGQINRLEWVTYAFVFLMIAIGSLLFWTNEPLFQRFVVEDGIVEWLTVIGLLSVTVVSLRRVVVLRPVRSFRFLLMTALLGLLFIFGAGEEISWGQRIFGIETSDFFQQHNAQRETNLHNMKIGDVSINKLIFSKIWLLSMLTYWFLVTPLYKRQQAFARFVDSFAVPIPQNHHIIANVAGLILAELLIDSTKRDELTEMAFGFLFLLNVAFPYNQRIFEPKSTL